MPDAQPLFLLDGLTERASSPEDWFTRELLHDARAGLVARRFQHARGVPHVVHPAPLRAAFAARIADQLEHARFVRHPYAHYPLDVARLAPDDTTDLATFLRWLTSEDAILFHTALVGAPLLDGQLPDAAAIEPVQVQASRMTAGQRFPRHVDAEEPGIAVVYNLTRALDPAGADGGVLRFAAMSDDDAPTIPPAFNTLTVFRADGAAHEVTRVAHDRGARYSVTAFYLLRP